MVRGSALGALSAALVLAGTGCGKPPPAAIDLTPYPFLAYARRPRPIAPADVNAMARRGLRAGERLDSAYALTAAGLGETVVQVVANDDQHSRAFVVNEDGAVESTNEFWAREVQMRQMRFGKMTPALFERQAALDQADPIDVEITIYADLPQPQLPFDGTGMRIPIDEYKDWFDTNARDQVQRLANIKAPIRAFLNAHAAVIEQDPGGLPIIQATIPVAVLDSVELNSNEIVRIDPVSTVPGHLDGDYAGRSAMNAPPSSGGLFGGQCDGPCDGENVDAGFWERDSSTRVTSGIARNNWRVSTGTLVTGYLNAPTTCNDDSDCEDLTAPDANRYCESVDGSKICVQDHLTWVVASVGMYGDYGYDHALSPRGAGPVS